VAAADDDDVEAAHGRLLDFARFYPTDRTRSKPIVSFT
jgi:hypothetical protein